MAQYFTIFVLLCFTVPTRASSESEENKDICKLPVEPGPCKGSFPRYFYNKKTKDCEKFIYGGCGGNDNNFKTEEDCEKFCENRRKICHLPIVVGPCKALFPRYFYNKKKEICEKFNYGGCGGNDNNFKSLEDCQNTCLITRVCPIYDLAKPPEGCHYEKSTGPDGCPKYTLVCDGSSA